MKFKKTLEFQKVYSSLNSAQKTAVDTIDGPVMVVAGPGTGKTQVLSARIANILCLTDTHPESILALTFTESAAINMRKRLVSMIGQTGYYVKITTFHSFCVEIIQTHPDYFDIPRNSEPLSELERYQIFQDLLLSLPVTSIRPINSPLYYLKDALNAIAELKREGVTISEYKKIIQSSVFKLDANPRMQEKNRDLLKLYSAYVATLHKIGRYDFEDMIQFVLEAFKKHKELVQEYQEKLLYFLVDEYQDTNNAQNQLLKKLTTYWGDSANIFVVGDPHQSIYRFQGASIENMVSFINWYPHATVIRLDVGYRAPQTFSDAASLLINNNQLTTSPEKNKKKGRVDFLKFMGTPVQSALNSTGRIEVQELPSQLVENIYIAERVKKLITSGVSANEIAVLYRNNSDAELLRETFDKWGIEYELDGGDDILKTDSTRQLIALFSLVNAIRNETDTSDLFEVLCFQWFQLDVSSIIKLGATAGVAKKSLKELILGGYEKYCKSAKDHAITPIDFHAIQRVVLNMVQWGVEDAQKVFPQWFEMVITESSYLDWATHQDDKIVLLTNLSTLFRQVKITANARRHFHLDEFVKVLETLSHFRIELKAEDLNIETDAVKLSTVHRAKGQEWDYVFLIHCIDGKWGNVLHRDLIPLPTSILKNTDLSKKERNEDERRLFYVALTRAKKNISISYPNTIINGSQSRQTTPSMFISEIPEKLYTFRSDFATPKNAGAYLEQLLTPQKTFFYTSIEESYFKSIVATFTLSATALNTYLSNVDEFVRNILLKIPRAKSSPMAFGSAIHTSLEHFYKHLQTTGERLSYQDVLANFETALKRELLTEDDFLRRLTHGRTILKGYYTTYLGNAKKPYMVERFFGGKYHPVMFGDIPLTGRIDRIDWVDQTKGLVRVIDYKTGSPKTIGELNGSTKSAQLSNREVDLPEEIRSGYKRQLIFYKLLTELDTHFEKKVVEGEFDFIEPEKTKGTYIKRSFQIEQHETDQLKELIKTVMEEIRSLSFLK